MTIASEPQYGGQQAGPMPPSQAETPTTTTSISLMGGVSSISGVSHHGEKPANTTPAAAIR